MVVLALSQIKAKRWEIRELSQFTTPYPGAAAVVPAKGISRGSWILETRDDPRKVRDFYEDLASRQKIPFQDTGHGEFVIGAGTNTVSVTAKDVAGLTRIYYVLLNSGAPDPD